MKRILFVAVGLSLLMWSAGTSLASGDTSTGKTKAVSCAGCHGASGEGVGQNPPLAGLEEAYFVKQSRDFKSGARENAMKKMIMQSLSDQDIADLAAYYTSLK